MEQKSNLRLSLVLLVYVSYGEGGALGTREQFCFTCHTLTLHSDFTYLELISFDGVEREQNHKQIKFAIHIQTKFSVLPSQGFFLGGLQDPPVANMLAELKQRVEQHTEILFFLCFSNIPFNAVFLHCVGVNDLLVPVVQDTTPSHVEPELPFVRPVT